MYTVRYCLFSVRTTLENVFKEKFSDRNDVINQDIYVKLYRYTSIKMYQHLMPH